MVRNGEGTRHVIRVAVTGAEDDRMAMKVEDCWGENVAETKKIMENSRKIMKHDGK